MDRPRKFGLATLQSERWKRESNDAVESMGGRCYFLFFSRHSFHFLRAACRRSSFSKPML